MTPEEQALATVVQTLERCGIAYMVTGSVASSDYGRPRSTHDADVVVDPTPGQLEEFVEALEGDGFYVDAGSAQQALRLRRAFNVIEMTFACKIDLIVRQDRDFSREEFSRRRPVDLTFRPNVAPTVSGIRVTDPGGPCPGSGWPRRAECLRSAAMAPWRGL